MTDRDQHFMQLALAQAQQAAERGEVPVGAVLVCDDEVVAAAHNAPIALCDPSAHAEMLAIRAAAEKLQNYRLNRCTLYVTLEPCPMCAGAILNARIKRVVYAAKDPKAGAAGSVLQILRHPQLPHLCAVTAGIEEQAAQTQLTEFFAQRRKLEKT